MAKTTKPAAAKTATLPTLNYTALARLAGGMVKAFGADKKGASSAAVKVYGKLAAAFPTQLDAAARIAAEAVCVVGSDAEAILNYTREMLEAVTAAAKSEGLAGD